MHTHIHIQKLKQQHRNPQNSIRSRRGDVQTIMRMKKMAIVGGEYGSRAGQPACGALWLAARTEFAYTPANSMLAQCSFYLPREAPSLRSAPLPHSYSA